MRWQRVILHLSLLMEIWGSMEHGLLFYAHTAVGGTARPDHGVGLSLVKTQKGMDGDQD